MLPDIAIIRKVVSEERISSIIREKSIGELATTLAVTSNRSAAKKYYVKNEALELTNSVQLSTSRQATRCAETQ
jgi:hypothetical protein